MRFRTTLLLLVALAALVITACAPVTVVQPTSAPPTAATQSTAEPPTPAAAQPTVAAALKTLRVGAPADDYRQDPKEPGRITVGMSSVNTNIFDTLTRMDENYQVEPMLAESWEFIAPSTWRFKLREDVKFHNGEPFTAQAVVDNLKRLTTGENAFFAGILKIDADSAKVVDDHTVDITTTGPVILPQQLVHPIFGIPAPGTDLLTERIGTGPFKEVEYVAKDHYTVARNEDYWGDKAKVDEITFRFYPDPNARVLALQADEVDMIYDVPLESATLLEGADGLNVLNGPTSAYQALTIMANGKDPYTIGADPKVREAIAYALDRKTISEASFGGRTTTDQTIIPTSILGQYGSNIKGYTFDAAKANALLDEAGWQVGSDGIREKDGKKLALELVCCFPEPTSNGRTSELIQAQLKDVGIDVSITNMPDDIAYDARLTEQKGDLWLEIGNQNSAYPCFLPAFLYYDAGEKSNNYQLAFTPKDFPQLNKDLDDCAVTTDADQAAQDAANVMKIMIDDAKIALPILGLYRLWGTNDRVQGFVPPAVNIHTRWDDISLAP